MLLLRQQQPILFSFFWLARLVASRGRTRSPPPPIALSCRSWRRTLGAESARASVSGSDRRERRAALDSDVTKPQSFVVNLSGGGCDFCDFLLNPPGVWAPRPCLQPRPRGARDNKGGDSAPDNGCNSDHWADETEIRSGFG